MTKMTKIMVSYLFKHIAALNQFMLKLKIWLFWPGFFAYIQSAGIQRGPIHKKRWKAAIQQF
jgi:hypothetical protein